MRVRAWAAARCVLQGLQPLAAPSKAFCMCAATQQRLHAQVLVLQLDKGHHHTCMCMAMLRASGGQDAPTTRPFLLLASHVTTQEAGLQQLQGLISVFELRINATSHRCALLISVPGARAGQACRTAHACEQAAAVPGISLSSCSSKLPVRLPRRLLQTAASAVLSSAAQCRLLTAEPWHAGTSCCCGSWCACPASTPWQLWTHCQALRSETSTHPR